MLELSRIRAGIWEGVIVAPDAPEIELVHLERSLADALIEAGRAVHVIGGADVAGELDAKRAIDQGTRLGASL